MIEISLYQPGMQQEWDDFARQSRNATFLLQRGYMDYHSDRFSDFSLVARTPQGRLAGLLPANRAGDTVLSHQGLTYGSWIVPFRHFDATVMMEITTAAIGFLKDNGVSRLVYKPIPYIYHRYPADDDIYALWRHGARLAECNISTAIDLVNPIPYDRGNKSGLKTAQRAGLKVEQADAAYPEFWQLLSSVLEQRHSTKPVHTLAEIELLRSRFPDHIKLYTATLDGTVVAGTVMFADGPVAHSQYIASSDEGRRVHALTAVFARVAADATAMGRRYLDFGISNEDHGRLLNAGLVQQKARLGGRGVAYNTFTLDL